MKKWNVASVRAAKGVQKLGCCTAYDACFARLADESGVPIILVGDSMGMTVLGYETTLPVKMEETLSATAAVARAAKNAMVVADLPFGSYQCGDDIAMKNAVDCIKAGADAVKLEGGDILEEEKYVFGASFSRNVKHFGGKIDACHIVSALGKDRGQSTRAASKVED